MDNWMLIGLGNHGSRYENTRHNIGWMIAEALAITEKASFRQGRGNWMQAECSVHGKKGTILLPLTYMNNAGQAAGEFCRYYKIPAEHVIAVVDEYNFPVGRMQIKQGGSDGGHNGTASMISHIGPAFWRLRCGIDKNFGPGEMADYVLAPFAAAEKDACKAMIDRAVKGLKMFLGSNPARAMQAINSDKPL
jgi:PTH1 family peptidyl-tRNA hydrolase